MPTVVRDSDFELFFPRRSEIDHAFMLLPPCAIVALTACAWVRISTSGTMAIFSYATPTYENALMGALRVDDNFWFAVNTAAVNVM